MKTKKRKRGLEVEDTRIAKKKKTNRKTERAKTETERKHNGSTYE
jgi:hypothetical protein